MSKKSTKKNPQKTNIISSILGSDIVWFSIAISVLLASVLFYFQVLQPRIINQISLQAQAQSIQISNTFSSQINELAKIQSEILNKNLNSFTEVCNPTQFYNNQDNDQFKIEQLNKKTST
ncbi:MAG: hypothetical protein HC932_00755 [Thermales bacterium]|nr:hypothetical protein [Thermales bacterium]